MLKNPDHSFVELEGHCRFGWPAFSSGAHRVLAGLTFTCFLSFFATVQAQCKPDEVLVGEDADNYYCMKKGQYDPASQKLASHFCRSKQAVSVDQSAIRQLGFAVDSERFELFATLAQERKAELEHRVLDALLDETLDATDLLAQSAKSLNPWNVSKATDMLKSKGFSHPAIIAALRRIARQKDKPAIAEGYRDFLKLVKSAKEGWNTGADIAREPDNGELRLLLGALKVMQGNPELGLAITGAELGEDLLYIAYLSGRVSELTKVSDEKLTRLARLSKKLRADVETMRASKAAWQKSAGYPSATPVCP